jgi:hypothetical protein
MNFFGRAKDRMVEHMALSYLNQNFLSPYGEARQLSIDSEAKTIHLQLALKGEATPVDIEISEYELSREGERYFVVVKGIRTSREWLTALAEDRLCHVRFELPPQAGHWLVQFL